jgi:hypothetical protein
MAKSADPVTLDFLAAQQRTLLGELAANRTEMAALRADIALIKDDISVLSSMAMRQDRATKRLLDMVQTLTLQQGRFNDRLRALEEQGP